MKGNCCWPGLVNMTEDVRDCQAWKASVTNARAHFKDREVSVIEAKKWLLRSRGKTAGTQAARNLGATELQERRYSLTKNDTRKLISWYFEPSQPQRITSGLKQTSICLLFSLHTSHQTTYFPQTTKSVLTQICIYNKAYKNVKHRIFEELVPSVLPLLTKHTQKNNKKSLSRS